VVLEILSIREPWLRSACRYFGHHWHAYVAEVELAPPDAYGGARLSYRLDPGDLEAAIRALPEPV
jgi:hypothetical protein